MLIDLMKKWILACMTLGLFFGQDPTQLMGEEKPMVSELVDIRSFIPNIQVDLKYATLDNFTGQIVYDFECCLLHKDAAMKLSDVQAELETIGLGLKVWDGFRPIAAQWKFWELVPDERYVSDPRKGGRHTRGTAVDLTLITLDGQELPMPSEFDDFSEKAHQNYMEASDMEIMNRELLREVMEKNHFTGLSTEWWHFDLDGWQNYPPLDINPKDNHPGLRKVNAPNRLKHWSFTNFSSGLITQTSANGWLLFAKRANHKKTR